MVLLFCAGLQATLKPVIDPKPLSSSRISVPGPKYWRNIFHTDTKFILIKCNKTPFNLSLIHCKKTSKNLLLAVIVKQTELCEEMNKAPTHWDDFSEYFFMDSLNVIFQSQTILKPLFYTAENWPNPEEKIETLRILIHTPFSKWNKTSHTLSIPMINIYIKKHNQFQEKAVLSGFLKMSFNFTAGPCTSAMTAGSVDGCTHTAEPQAPAWLANVHWGCCCLQEDSQLKNNFFVFYPSCCW